MCFVCGELGLGEGKAGHLMEQLDVMGWMALEEEELRALTRTQQPGGCCGWLASTEVPRPLQLVEQRRRSSYQLLHLSAHHHLIHS